MDSKLFKELNSNLEQFGIRIDNLSFKDTPRGFNYMFTIRSIIKPEACLMAPPTFFYITVLEEDLISTDTTPYRLVYIQLKRTLLDYRYSELHQCFHQAKNHFESVQMYDFFNI